MSDDITLLEEYYDDILAVLPSDKQQAITILALAIATLSRDSELTIDGTLFIMRTAIVLVEQQSLPKAAGGTR